MQRGSHVPDEAAILLVEDRQDDILLVRRAFRKAGVPNPIEAVNDGEEAMAYLLGIGQYADRARFPFPTLVLLDLKMMKMNGFETLRWIRSLPAFKSLRVIVLTSSEDIFDVNKAYELGANSFLVKPVDFEHFVQISQALKGYWLWMSKAPEVERPTRTNKQRGGR